MWYRIVRGLWMWREGDDGKRYLPTVPTQTSSSAAHAISRCKRYVRSEMKDLSVSY